MRRVLHNIAQFSGQAVIYAGFAAFLGYFANGPDYARIGADEALVKVSFAHGAKAKGGCRRLSREELLKLAPNMRKPTECPRERLPVFVWVSIDGEIRFEAELPPSGLHSDGPSRMYERIVVPSGRHTIALALRDTERDDGFDYEINRDVELAAGQSLAIDFFATEGFVFK